MNEFLSELENKKININWNENPIKMDVFLSFLTVKVRIGTGHTGYDTCWTKRYGDNGLIIGGGVYKGVEYLDSLMYGEKLQNPYNNYVNPFFLFEILSDEGKKFFLDYYSEDIQKQLNKASSNLKSAQLHMNEVSQFWSELGVSYERSV